ncbi:MAG: hypothetical protein WD874_01030 [Parcubacteria group bacterium]
MKTPEGFEVDAWQMKYFQNRPESKGLVYTKEEEKELIDLRSDRTTEHPQESIDWDKIVFRNSQWFGDLTRISRTSEIDDRKNHTDLIVDFLNEDESEIVAKLTVDTTVSNEGNVGTKLNTVVDDVENRFTLSSLRHATTVEKGKFKPYKNAPHAVIAIGKNDLMSYQEGQIPESNLQKKVLDQVFAQLTLERSFIASSNKLPPLIQTELISKIDRVLSEINKTLSSMKKPSELQRVWDIGTEYASDPEKISKICPRLKAS